MFRKLRTISTRLGTKFVAWQAVGLGLPLVMSVSVLGLVLHLQPMPSYAQIHSQEAANKQTGTHHVATPVKAVQPAAAAATKPIVVAPTTAAPAPVKTLVQTGTPKPEPVVTPSPSSNVSGLAPATPAPSSPAPSSQTTTSYTSTNWSGYLATGGSFTAISGSWAVTAASGNGSTISADSTWIGIGGVTSGDLIQVGTQNIISASGQVSASAFYEILPATSQPVPGVTIAPGDSMTASITQVGIGQWTISIIDNTNGQSSTMSVAYNSSLSSAEWIEEDPSFSSRRQIPFDNFHEAAFTNGSTVDNGANLTITASTAQPVTMVNSTGQTVVALPSAIGGNGASFTVTP